MAVTRAEISAELDRVACEWRVPLSKLRGDRKKWGTPPRLVIAARAAFMRRMFAENVPTGHAAWALNISDGSAREWYSVLRKAERAWWGVKAS